MKQYHSRRGLTIAEVLVMIAILVIVGCFLWPSLYRTRCISSSVVRCQSNLKQLYAFSLLYSDKFGHGFHPIAPGEAPQAHDSLQLLANLFPEIPPGLLTCPEGNAVPAQPDSKSGALVLTASNVDYAWTATPVSNQTPKAVLCSDKYMHGGHEGGFNVLWSDGSVSFVVESDPMITKDKLPRGLVR